jgi:hypothetical protein
MVLSPSWSWSSIELGDRLYATLFSHPDLNQKLEDALAKRNSGTHFVRIEMEFSGQSAFMAGWPWEYLYRLIQRGKRESGEFLALSTNLVLNRVLNSDFGKEFSTRSPSMLLVVSRPSDKGPVDCVDIRTLVTKLKQDGVITLHDELIEPEWEELVANREPVVSWEAFSKSVRDNKPHVIHFIGHGQVVYKPEIRKNVGQLAFVGKEGGKAEWHDEEEVAALLTPSTSLRLVFLQACESGKTDPQAEGSGVARSIALRKVPAVVAMQAKVKNDVASKFACTLYNNLAAGLPIDWAVMKGREAVNELEKVPERRLSFGVPIVYLSSYLGLIDPNADANAQGGRSEIKTTTGEGEFTCPVCGFRLKRKTNYCTNAKCLRPRLRTTEPRTVPGARARQRGLLISHAS